MDVISPGLEGFIRDRWIAKVPLIAVALKTAVSGGFLRGDVAEEGVKFLHLILLQHWTLRCPVATLLQVLHVENELKLLPQPAETAVALQLVRHKFAQHFLKELKPHLSGAAFPLQQLPAYLLEDARRQVGDLITRNDVYDNESQQCLSQFLQFGSLCPFLIWRALPILELVYFWPVLLDEGLDDRRHAN